MNKDEDLQSHLARRMLNEEKDYSADGRKRVVVLEVA
jgi:hypothetical protein